MKDIGLEQHEATVLFEDNNGALLMANAQQPTKRTRHMDIKHFALIDWVEQDLIVLEHIKTSDNIADAVTKTLSKSLFYRHFNTYMGLRIPAYCARTINQDAKHDKFTPSKHYSAHSRTNVSSLQNPGGHQAETLLPSMGGGTRHTYVSTE
jgi:hypothetical protein